MAGKSKVYEEAMAMATNSSWDQNWPGAVRAYRAALEEFPQDVAALVGLGTAYFELAQYESAARSLQRAMKFDPTNHEAMNKIGESLEKLNRFDDAVKTYIYSGNTYAKAGQLEDAISVWKKAAQVKPDLVQVRNNLAQAYARLGKRDDAIAELVSLAALYQEHGDTQKAGQWLRGALQLDPDSIYAGAALEALRNGASIHSIPQEIAPQPPSQPEIPDIVEPSESEEELFLIDEEEEEEEIGNPHEKTNQMALEALASVLFEDESQYEGQLSVSKLEIDAYIGQAIDRQTRGQIDEAIKIYEKIIESGFGHAAAHFILADLYLNSGQYDQAIKHFDQAKKDKSYLIGVNFALGTCYKDSGDANQALRHFVEVLKIIDLEKSHRASTGELEQLYMALLDNYLARGDDEATMAFANSLVNFLSSKNWESKIARARQRLGIDDGTAVSAWIEFLEAGETEIILSAMSDTAEYMRQNMLMTAAEACYWAIQHAPNYLPLHISLAEIYLKQERIENSINKYLAVAEVYQIRDNMSQVIAIYQKILNVAPMDVTVRSKLIELNISLGNIDAAMEHYMILADAYYQLAQVGLALEKYQEALKLAPGASQPKVWQTDVLAKMGDIYNQRVDWRNATQVYEQLVKLSPENDKALLQLIDLYFKLGQVDKAIKTLNGVLTLYNKQQNQTKMLQVLQDLVELRPQELALHKKLAAFYIELGMTKQALEQYNVLGEMQLEAGLPDDAAHTIETIIKLGPDDLEGYRTLLSQIRGGI